VLILASLTMSAALHAAESSVIRVFAAGRLRSAFTEIGIAFQSATGIRVESSFGRSGALRERIEKGEQPDLFASADMGAAAAQCETAPRFFARRPLQRTPNRVYEAASTIDGDGVPRNRSSELMTPAARP
jgi:ABC-type molybdate transport system substrate-binding protein